jgi:DNA-binding NtrC family response regulator
MSGSDVKVIVMSRGANIESAKEALQLGTMAYLLKPFNFSEFLTLVEED